MKKINGKLLLDHFEEIVASVLFMATLSLVILNVITRYVFRTGISWSEEFATGCFVWTAFIGSAACYKHRAHVVVDVVVNRLPTPAQNAVRILVDCLMVFLCAYLFYLSIIYVQRSYRKPTAILGISSATVSVSLTLAFLDMAVWSVIFVFRDLKSIKEHGKVINGEEES